MNPLYYDLAEVHSVNYDGWASGRALEQFLHVVWYRGERFLLDRDQLLALRVGAFKIESISTPVRTSVSIDGVPWEIHEIDGPVARTAARTAWRAAAEATHDIVVSKASDCVFGTWFPCWAGVREVRSWKEGAYKVTLSLRDDNPVFAPIVASSRLY